MRSREQREGDEAQERAWADWVDSGQLTTRDLVVVTGLSMRRIQERIQRARQLRYGKRLPRFEIVSPPNGLDATENCFHDSHPIPQGDLVYCSQCHRTGCDHWPALQVSPAELPKAEYRPPESEGLSGGLGTMGRKSSRKMSKACRS